MISQNRRWVWLLATGAAGILVALGVLAGLYTNRQAGNVPLAVLPTHTSPIQVTSLPVSVTLTVPSAFPTISPTVAGTSAVPMAASPSVTLTTIPTQAPPGQYTVQAGETLSEIAFSLGVSLADLLAANPAIENPNLVQAGQVLNLPSTAAGVPAAEGVASTGTQQAYTDLISVLGSSQERVEAAYPASQPIVEGRLVVHYQPGAYVDQHLTDVLDQFSQAYRVVEAALGGPFGRPLHLYAAGSLFYANEDLRGFTQSGLYRSFILVDGGGNAGERTYYAAHELTHIFAYHRLGRPSGPLLHEGLATYLPHRFLSEAGGYLPLDQVCAAALAAGRLDPLAALAAAELGPPYFAGHTNNFIQYHQSACFVQYLLDTYGWEKFGQVYSSAAYQSVYGLGLDELESQWLVLLRQVSYTVDPAPFVQVLDQVAEAYRDYYARCSGGRHADWQAYLALDRARLATYAGRLDEALEALSTYRLFTV